MKTKLRKLGDITSDMEPLILEMVEQHGLQYHEILFLIYGYLLVHCPGARETYVEGGHPVLFYGPKEK